jgi:hypothetical protein
MDRATSQTKLVAFTAHAPSHGIVAATATAAAAEPKTRSRVLVTVLACSCHGFARLLGSMVTPIDARFGSCFFLAGWVEEVIICSISSRALRAR